MEGLNETEKHLLLNLLQNIYQGTAVLYERKEGEIFNELPERSLLPQACKGQ
ncbi:hypothetical protein [Bacillus sp. TL12]|uniref:hypothetical protein n=1 Tax=Bacillus sp. TL12 TaxID=2894756 RepID=UPI001F528035|nr:hypothetical protein [Bacillus sp. TL12]MCI0768244.1 hypothetical protein [Bacillus sp. TL12]